MIYLSRPVFQFAINWRESIIRSFTHDLRELSLGFNEEVFTSRQIDVVNGWNVTMSLPTEDDIKAVDDFFADRIGSLLGFWFPVPMAAMKVVAQVSSTQFDIEGQNLAATWDQSADTHLYFDDGTVQQAARMTGVVDNGNGTERVTITPFLSPQVGPTMRVYRLHYVRLAGDTEQARFVREGHQERTLSVVELPQEYTLAETGQRPIFLYHFWIAAPVDVHWYFTSFEADVISNSKTHLASPIIHGSLKSSMQFEGETVEIQSAYAVNHPLTFFLPKSSGRFVNVTIQQCYFATPDTVTTLFAGQVRTVNDRGTHLVAQCDSFLSLLRRKLPPMVISENCPYQVFEPNTCKAGLFKYSTTGHITAIDNTAQPPTVQMSLRFPTTPFTVPDNFALGWMETGMQLGYEIRTIFASSWNGGTSRLTLTINAPLINAVVGQEIQITPGCDGKAATCKEKFNNFVHFGGFPQVPKTNPSIAAIEAKTSAGDKK